MKNILLEKNEILMENIDLPIDYGETCASKSMKPLNDVIQDIIHENKEISKEFIDKIEMMENEKFIDVGDLDSLFGNLEITW